MNPKFCIRQFLKHAIALNLMLLLVCCSQALAKQYFTVSPYVQLGYQFKGKNLTICWLSEEALSPGLVLDYKASTESSWKQSKKIQTQVVNGHPSIKIFSAEITDLPPATSINYRIVNANKEIFQSAFKSPPEAGKPMDFAVLGDIGQGTEGEAEMAGLWRVKRPPMVMIMGDIVYPVGSMNNYLRNFFPYLNSDDSNEKGSAVLRSTLTVGVVGNHDLAEGGGIDARDLNISADGMSYFLIWKQPLNGPITEPGKNCSQPRGNQERIDTFLKSAGQAYPRMAMFSFDYGDCHILALDANSYVDWTDEKLRKWVENDLKSSKAPWKIVCFHQPGFNSDWAHREDQQMRHMAEIFERTGVDICFSGHSHSYQRSYPIHFREVASPEGSREARAGYVHGSFKIDKTFDGDKVSKADGVIYVITGAGGAHLSSPQLDVEVSQWLPFTKKFNARQHSMSMCHVDGKRFTMQQVASDGSIIDSFSINK